MATSPTFPLSFNFLFFLIFLALAPLAFSTFPTSSFGSSQHEFWSKNVLNIMPEAVLSKLSPLSKQDSDSLASLVSKESFSPDAKFCSMANLACETKLQNSLITRNVYRNIYAAIGSIHLSDDRADPNSFFRLSILRNGNKVQLPNLNNQIPARAFLPSKIASKMPTTSSNDLQKLFPESFLSPRTKETIEASILSCSAPPLKGEVKSCPTSLEEMIEFSKKALDKKQLIASTSESTKGSEKNLEIANIKQFHEEKAVSCHEVFFPFATYFCHLLSSSSLYAVDFIEPKTKASINKVFAICHMDTSEWPAEHVALKIPKFSPGQGEACHWSTNIDLAWMGN